MKLPYSFSRNPLKKNRFENLPYNTKSNRVAFVFPLRHCSFIYFIFVVLLTTVCWVAAFGPAHRVCLSLCFFYRLPNSFLYIIFLLKSHIFLNCLIWFRSKCTYPFINNKFCNIICSFFFSTVRMHVKAASFHTFNNEKDR